MFVPLSEMPEDSRVWIYQSNRLFTEEEVETLYRQVETFVRNWEAHAVALHASFEIRYHRFLVLLVDASVHAPSGCSIDESVHFVQSLEKQYRVDLLDKMNVTFKIGAETFYESLSDFKKKLKHKEVSSDTIVFNNLVVNKYEYEHFWEVPLSESWHSRFLKH